MGFLNRSKLAPCKNSEWELLEDFNYVTRGGIKIKVPKGFKTDLASIPALARVIIPVNGRWTGAAIIHDYLYATKDKRAYSRKFCDDIFLEAMEDLGVSWLTRHVMHKAVRAGGWIYWNF